MNDEKTNSNEKNYSYEWQLISPVLDYYQEKMDAAVNSNTERLRKNEIFWEINKISNERSRYIYNIFYIEKKISRKLYDYCCNQKIVDTNLIAKWKKQGYEKLCCVSCISSNMTNFSNVCICRIPNPPQNLRCNTCGCSGCSSNIEN